MSIIVYIKDRVDDIIYALKVNRNKALVASACMIVGLIFGAVLCGATLNSDSEMSEFVYRCYCGSFIQVFTAFFIWSVITFLLIVVSDTFTAARIVPYLLSLFIGLRGGNNIYALIYFCGIWGVFCAIFIVFLQCILDIVVISISPTAKGCNKSIMEAISDCRQGTVILAVSLIVRLLIVFLILRL